MGLWLYNKRLHIQKNKNHFQVSIKTEDIRKEKKNLVQ